MRRRLPLGKGRLATNAAFTADNARLVVVAGRRLYVYDLPSGAQLAEFDGCQADVRQISRILP